MDRSQAYGVVSQALDLAQDLSGHVMLRNPKNLKRGLSRKDLRKELEVSHEAFRRATADAYVLVETISQWANEYPLEEK